LRLRSDNLQIAAELCHRCQIVPTVLVEVIMNGLIYLVGLVVVILAILSFFGLR
jgi:hypothetical protein